MRTDSGMITKLFFSLLPVQIMLIGISSMNAIVDSMMASNFIGPDALAMTGLFLPVVKIVETVNMVLLGGSQILCGQFLGKNQIERTRGVFSLDICLITGFSLVITAVCLAVPETLAGILRADSATREGLIRYIYGMAGGFLPEMVSLQLVSFLQIEQQEKRTYAGMTAMVGTNILLDFIFIRVLNWDMLGLGLATSISYVVFFIILGSYYFTKKAVIKYNSQLILASDISPIIMIGIPGALSTFCQALRGILLNTLLLSTAGNAGVSALSALNSFGYLLYAFTAGIAAATRLLGSVYIGEEDRKSLIAVMKVALLKGTPIVCGIAAVVMAMAGPITYLFYKDTTSEVYYLTEWLFRIYPLCMPLSAICVVFINYYQSFERMKIVNLLSAADGILGIGAASLILAPLYGAMGIWAAHVINGVITTLIIIGYAWMINRKFPGSIEDLLTIPEDFGAAEDECIDISIHDAEEVASTSEKIIEFCARNGVDHKRSFYAGLCMEEMADNIVEHGFDDGKKHFADVRVVYKNDELTLRIKDDCRAFDPKEKLALVDPDDVTKNIGLRMVQKLAKDMSYTNMLGLNVLTMTI